MTSKIQKRISESEYLIVSLTEDIKIQCTDRTLDSEVFVFGRKFVDTGKGHFLGFYDWLRDSNGIFVGIDFFPFSLAELLRHFKPPMQVEVQGDSFVRIYFGSQTEFDPENSILQCFSDTRCFVDESGIYCLAFGLFELDSKAKKGLIEQADRSSQRAG